VGYASTEAEDDQGETVSREALSAALDDYMRFANIIARSHQPSAVGIATEARGRRQRASISEPRSVTAMAWRKVVEGVYKGFSIAQGDCPDPGDRR